MWNRVRKDLPQFSLLGLFWFASAVAIGIAVNQVKPEEGAVPVAQSAGFLASSFEIAVVLVIHELVRQYWQMRSSSHTLSLEPFQWRFARWVRGALAIGIAGLLLATMLINQRIVTLAEYENWIVPVVLWPEGLLTLLTLLAMRLMVQHRVRVTCSRSFRVMSSVLVVAGVVLIGLYALTDRLCIHWFVHVAMDGVEKGHAIRWHRAGVYPHHESEGFFSFWSSCAALLVIAIAAVSLVVAANVRSRLGAACCWVLFAAGVVAAGGYASWFWTQELPRISPDMMERPLPSVRRELLSGLLLFVGLAALLGYRLAMLKSNQRSQSPPPSMSLPRPAGLMAIAAAILSLGVWGVIAEQLVAFQPSTGFWSFHDNYWLHAVGSVVSNLLWSASMISIAVVVSGMTLLWQYYRPIHDVQTLRPLRGGAFVVYTLATLILLLVAMPTFAAFGFCYWLGPWVL